MFTKIWDWLQGKKLYVGGVATILTGIGQIGLGYYNGQGFNIEGWNYILAGWAMIAGKSALTKKNTEPLTEPPPKAKDLV